MRHLKRVMTQNSILILIKNIKKSLNLQKSDIRKRKKKENVKKKKMKWRENKRAKALLLFAENFSLKNLS